MRSTTGPAIYLLNPGWASPQTLSGHATFFAFRRQRRSVCAFTEPHAVDGRPGNRSRICSRIVGSGSSESFGNSERMRASLEVSSGDESATMLSINSRTRLPWNYAAIGRTAKVAAALASPSYEPSANKAALRLNTHGAGPGAMPLEVTEAEVSQKRRN